MQDKMIQDEVPGAVEESSEDRTIPALLASSKTHRTEVYSIIDAIPLLATSPREEEAKTERFQCVLDMYQEQPVLLDAYLSDMITKLLAFVNFLQEGQSRFDNESRIALTFLTHCAKVRGYKHLLALLPHEVSYMEPVLSSLERWEGAVCEEPAKYVLLLWLTILCKNPFDFCRFDTPRQGHTVHRIIAAVKPFLYTHPNRAHPVTALLLATVVTREDARTELLASTVRTCVSELSTCRLGGSDDVCLTGNLYLLTAIFKHGRRDDLLPLADLALDVISPLLNKDRAGCMLNKLLIKLVQRLGMVFLKPKVAKWRYDRGSRVLTLNEDTTSLRKAEDNTGSEMESVEEQDDDQYDIPCKVLESVLDALLTALRNAFTGVRWSAAKGIGRVCSRLPKELANDVISTILKSHFNQLAGHAAWNGGCLALAELCRRGYLLPDRLQHVVPLLLKALVFEEKQGRHTLGANVRDAACYIAWAFARAFHPKHLVDFVNCIAETLVCVALFDREVNVRRAASAAFQENVGRQGSFPNGIEILTLIDYFAVATTKHTYLHVAPQVAVFPLYASPLITHLIDCKITHCDENIRILAAEALSRLASFDTVTTLHQVLTKIIPLLRMRQPVSRQGGIMALAGSLSGLHSCGAVVSRELCHRCARIPNDNLELCTRKADSLGSALICKAITMFIRLLVKVVPTGIIPMEEWLKATDVIACDPSEQLRNEAVQAAIELYAVPLRTTQLAQHVCSNYIYQVHSADKECKREGLANLLSALPLDVYSSTMDGCLMSGTIIRLLISFVDERQGRDALWAYGRRACMDGLVKIVNVIGFPAMVISDSTRLINCVIHALNDYTVDRRGDVGRVLRSSALRALCTLLPSAQQCNRLDHTTTDIAICKVVEQSCERIDTLRTCASEVLCELLTSGLNIVDKEDLAQVYLLDNDKYPHWLPADWGRERQGCFTRLAQLLNSKHYRYHALLGFVVSAGGHGESTLRAASEALLTELTAHRDSMQDMEQYLQDLLLIYSENAGVKRITVPWLTTLEQVFSAQVFSVFQPNPDASPALCKLVDRLLAQTTKKQTSAQQLRLSVAVLCHVMHFNCDSHLWHRAATVVVHSLHSSCPVLRRSTAERLYEYVCADDIATDQFLNKDHLVNLLVNTEWQSDLDLDYFKYISHNIAPLLNCTL